MAIALGGCLRAPPVEYGITEDTGGHITYVLGAMQALADAPGVDHAEIVTRLIDDPQLGPDYARAHEEVAPRLSITRIDSGNRDYLSKEALARDLEAFKRAFLADLAARESLPDIIHAHFSDAAEVALAAREAFGIPFIYTAHSLLADKVQGERCAQQQARFDAEDRAIASADAIIASSRDECERQLPAYPSIRQGRVHRVIPGVEAVAGGEAEMAGARALIAPFLRDADKPLVLAVARPVHKKNLAGLVEAFGRDPQLRKRANLAIMPGLRKSIRSGEAEQREVMADIVDAIDRHDLHGHVAWPRRHTQRDIAGLYALARTSGGVFVNPALIEPYGLTLVEAAAYGVPVVATQHGGPVDIVAELQHGLLADPRDPAAIAGGITRLLDDKELWRECSAHGVRRAAAMDWAGYARDFLAIAREAIAPPVRVHAPARLVLSDIDNTLTGCAAGAKRLRAWLDTQRDTAFGIATGRSFHEAMRILRRWHFPTPDLLVTDVGSAIWWHGPDGLERDEDYAAYIGHGWDGDAVERALRPIPGLTPQRGVDQSAFKRSWFTASPSVARAAQTALEQAGIAAKCVFSHSNMFDVLPPRAGKAGAMRHVAARLGLPLSQVIAIGDSGNDEDMLRECPNAVLVGNHAGELAGLAARQNVYVAKAHHAGGALEGILQVIGRLDHPPARPALMRRRDATLRDAA
jgi:sucrose-phosphate synthase